MMVGFLTELLVLLCIPFGKLIILDDQSVLYIKQIIAIFESNPWDQSFDHVILAPVSMPTIPLLFLMSLVLRYQLAIACPIHGRKLKCSSWTVSNKISNSQQPRLIYCTDNNIVLVQQVLVCEVSGHSYLPTSRTIFSDPSIPKECYFPYQLYHRCIFSHNLIEHIFWCFVSANSWRTCIKALHEFCKGISRYGRILFFIKSVICFSYGGHDRINVSGYVYASKRFLFLKYGETSIINISKSFF